MIDMPPAPLQYPDARRVRAEELLRDHNRDVNSPVPVLQSLGDKRVAFTGTLSERRENFELRARSCNALIQDDVTGTTDVVVQGEPSPSYKWGNIGTKLRRVSDERKRGRLIYVITESELWQLLEGRALSRTQSQAAAGSTVSPLGVSYRPPLDKGVESVRGRRAMAVDLDERDRKLREHFRLTGMAADVLKDAGLVPRSPVGQVCAYDLAWMKGRSFQVLEVKTTTPESEVQQMRLGLGQVLEYRTWLRSQKPNWRVEGHLLVSARPTQKRTLAACKAADVSVWWPERLRDLP
jgi:hypothetical protein